MNKTKICSTCAQEKTLSCFYARGDCKGYRHQCKDCMRIRQAKRWAENSDFRERGIKRSRRWQRQKFYGLSLDQEQNFLETQKNSCAICNKPFKTDADYHVDHCHNTNQVRGLLCPSCNKALGLFKDNAEALRRAAIYVESQGVKIPNKTNSK
jgi:hypothetical protein